MITSPKAASGQRDVLGVHGNTAADRRDAARYIHRRAHNPQDEQHLTALLGLTPTDWKETADMKRLTAAEQLAAQHRDDTLAAIVQSSDWDRALVEQAVIAYGTEHAEFSANDMRDLLPEQGAGFLGAAFRALACAGVLVRTGQYVPSTSPSTHGHRIAVYRLHFDYQLRIDRARQAGAAA